MTPQSSTQGLLPTPTGPSRTWRRSRAVLPLLGATGTLGALLVGVPALLVTLVGNPYPEGGLHLDGPLTDGAVLGLLACLGWGLWAQLLVCVVVETAAQVRLIRLDRSLRAGAGRTTGEVRRTGFDGHLGGWMARVPGTFAGQQQVARALVQIIVTAVLGLTATTAAATTVAPQAAAATVPTDATTPPMRQVNSHPSTPSSTTENAHQRAPTPPPSTRSTATASPDDRPSVVVARGDTLWSLAERHLGTGEAWRTIAELNLGRPMSDTETFTSASAIRPGWTLLLPEAPGAAKAAGNHAETLTVAPGDTLWELAEESLDDGTRWPTLYAANRDQIQDPDLIYPGQLLDVPAQPNGQPNLDPTGLTQPTAPSTDARNRRPANEREEVPPGSGVAETPRIVPPVPAPSRQPTTGPTPSPAAPSRTVTPTPAPASTTGPAQQPTASSMSPAQQEANDDLLPGGLLALLSGGGALFGAGMLALLRNHRGRHFRHRRSGRTVPTTPEPLVEAEAAVIAAGPDGAEDAVFLDQALRGLVDLVAAHPTAELPDVTTVRLGHDSLELHLTTPLTTAPAPWVADASGLTWSLPRTTPLQPSTALAPYPALASIGTDDAGGTWLLDLERAGILHVTGEPTAAADLARFLVAELAVNSWSDTVLVEAGDFAAPLTQLRPERVTAITGDPLPDLVKTAQRVDEACDRMGCDVLSGRVDGRAGDTWMPTVVVVTDEEVTTDGLAALQAELVGVPRRAAVLVLLEAAADHLPDDGPTTTEGEPKLRIDADGTVTLLPGGVRLSGNRLTARETYDIAALFGHLDEAEDEPMPPAAGSAPYQSVTDAAGALRPEHTTTRDATGRTQDSRSSLLPLPDSDYCEHAATTSEDLAALAPGVPQQVRRELQALDPELDGDLAEWKQAKPSRPRLRVLGPVELQVAAVPVGDVARRPAFNAEVVAYLLAHPHGATPAQTAEAFHCQANTIQSRVTDLRRWLGTDPATGEPHLPVSPLSPGGRVRGVPVYQAVGVLCDADLFRRLRARGQARGVDGIGDLVAALELVSGQPFDHLRRHGYGWLAETPTHHHLTAAIVDVAHIVSTHYLTSGRPDRAAWAAEKGILAAPTDDKPRLDLAAAHRALGGRHTSSTGSDLLARPGIEHEDPPPRTRRILEQWDEG